MWWKWGFTALIIYLAVGDVRNTRVGRPLTDTPASRQPPQNDSRPQDGRQGAARQNQPGNAPKDSGSWRRPAVTSRGGGAGNNGHSQPRGVATATAEMAAAAARVATAAHGVATAAAREGQSGATATVGRPRPNTAKVGTHVGVAGLGAFDPLDLGRLSGGLAPSAVPQMPHGKSLASTLMHC